MRMPIKQVLEPLIHSAAMTLSLLAVYSIQGKSLPWFAWVIAFALFAIAARVWRSILKPSGDRAPAPSPKPAVTFAAVSAIILLALLALLIL